MIYICTEFFIIWAHYLHNVRSREKFSRKALSHFFQTILYIQSAWKISVEPKCKGIYSLISSVFLDRRTFANRMSIRVCSELSDW